MFKDKKIKLLTKNKQFRNELISNHLLSFLDPPMDAKSKLELPTPPTFSQMMEDLDIMASDDKIFKLFQL